MLPVPKLRQPDETSCLPTCIEAVLRFLGYGCSPAEVREWCYTTNSGCDADLAVQGLRDAGYDATLGQVTIADLREMLDSGYPPIIVLPEGDGWYHAAVVCDISAAGFVLMDPRIGDYQFLPHESLLEKWLPGHDEVMQVGKTAS
jgi:ABC-type bacteriocin/lantibiotic exporter with double-glycine peptidase domain